MSNFDHLIKKLPSSRSRLSAHPIEHLQGEREREESSLEEKKEKTLDFPILPAGFTLFVKKFLRSLPLGAKIESPTEIYSVLLQRISSLEKALITISEEDVSYKPEFTNKLSLLWEELNEEISKLETKENNSENIITKIQLLIEDFASFPYERDHTIGYYLSQSVGLDWLPLPYLQILRNLHNSYQESHENSPLGKWIAEIQSILASTKKNT